jgi:hypothetical protein
MTHIHTYIVTYIHTKVGVYELFTSQWTEWLYVLGDFRLLDFYPLGSFLSISKIAHILGHFFPWHKLPSYVINMTKMGWLHFWCFLSQTHLGSMLWSQFSAIFDNFRRKYFKNHNIGPWSTLDKLQGDDAGEHEAVLVLVDDKQVSNLES